MAAKPYIGVTGYKHFADVKLILDKCDFPVGYLMFGFTSSDKRLLDPSSEGKTSPSLDRLPELVNLVPKHHLPMVHYFTKTPEKVYEEILALFKHCHLDSSHCGLQLNLHWPDPKQLKAICAILSGLTITLQLPRPVLELTDAEIVEKLKPYQGSVQYALIDPSGGQGLDFDLQRAGALMMAMQENLEITPGVAGGFGPNNVKSRIRALSEISLCDGCNRPKLENYCIDAQGKLRNDSFRQPVYPKDTPAIKYSSFSTVKTAKYIEAALRAFCE